MTADLRALQERLRGSGSTTVCCHPDVCHLPLDNDDRKCVLDAGRPSDCDVATHEKLRSKDKCPYWQAAPIVVPQALTIDEASALLDEIESKDARIAKLIEENRQLVADYGARGDLLAEARARIAELEREAEIFDEDHADQNRMVDRIADLIGLPHDQELDTTAFELWFSKINSSAEHSDRVIAGLNKQLTEQFELSTKYVALAERYRAALENIIDAANSFCDESGDDVAAQVKIRARDALSPSQGDAS